jgi:hypothetical protein
MNDHDRQAPGGNCQSELLLAKDQCLLSLQKTEEAEGLCLEYIQRDVPRERKLKVIGGAPCFILYQSSSPFLKHAERLARGFGSCSGTLTFKGTLGSLLAEQGNYCEAEPLLVSVSIAAQLSTTGQSTFYLGMTKSRTDNTNEGQRLTKRGMKMCPEAWIVVKGNAKRTKRVWLFLWLPRARVKASSRGWL